MEYDYRKDNIIVRFDIGDEIVEELTHIAKEEDISGAHVSGIGALRDFTLGFYDIETQEYKKDTFEDPHELTNATGFITRLEEEPHVHVHATLAGPQHKIIGGHLHAGTVSAAGEFILTPVGDINRQHINDTGLDILHLSQKDDE